MSIDARIVSVEQLTTGFAYLYLEPRDSRSGPAGRRRLTVLNPPPHLDAAVGLCIWGGSSQIMIGDTKWADRIGFQQIRLVKRNGDVGDVAT